MFIGGLNLWNGSDVSCKDGNESDEYAVVINTHVEHKPNTWFGCDYALWNKSARWQQTHRSLQTTQTNSFIKKS